MRVLKNNNAWENDILTQFQGIGPGPLVFKDFQVAQTCRLEWEPLTGREGSSPLKRGQGFYSSQLGPHSCQGYPDIGGVALLPVEQDLKGLSKNELLPLGIILVESSQVQKCSSFASELWPGWDSQFAFSFFFWSPIFLPLISYV